MKDKIKFIEKEISDLRNKLKNHELYQNLNSIKDINLFMSSHVFAVWDFMSLLKSLQSKLTYTETPWLPRKDGEVARFINEIVLAEESDIDSEGFIKSHFEMYLESMSQNQANSNEINCFLRLVNSGINVRHALNEINIDLRVVDFVNYTFSLIESNQVHLIAASFTFGREDIIPDMFFEILNNSANGSNRYSKLKYYLERHIELDADEHGPLSLKMISKLCGKDEQKWADVLNVSKQSLEKRISLWDCINDQILNKTIPKTLSNS